MAGSGHGAIFDGETERLQVAPAATDAEPQVIYESDQRITAVGWQDQG